MEGRKQNNQIAKNTIFLYIRMLLIMLVSVYTVRIVLSALGLDDYGVYGAIGGLITSLSFVTSVLANASQRFFSMGIGEGDNSKLSKTFSMMFWIYLIAGIIVICLFETLGLWFLETKMIIPDGRHNAAQWVFHFMILSFLVSLVNAPYQALIISHERMSIYAYVGIIDVILKLLIAFLLQWLPFDKLKLYSILLFLTSLVTTSIYICYCLRNFLEARVRFIWDSKIFKDVFFFSSWTMFGSFSYICNTQGINLLLNVFFGPLANTAYSIGNQIKSLVNQFSSNFYSAARPALLKAYASHDLINVNGLFFFSSRFIFVLLFIIVYPLFLNIDFVLTLWLGSVGDYMSEFVRLMLVYAVVLSMSDPITTVIQAANKVKVYYLIVDTFTLLTLPLTYIAFKLSLPASIAFYISIVIFIIAHLIRLFLFRPLTGISIISYIKKIVFPVLIVSIISIILSTLVRTGVCSNQMNEILCNFILILMDTIIGFVTTFYIILNKSERIKIYSFIKNKISKR